MARSRTIAPSFFSDEFLGSEDPLLGWLFAGLWCHADREGLLDDRPKYLAGQLFPYRGTTGRVVNGMLDILEQHQYISRLRACVHPDQVKTVRSMMAVYREPWEGPVDNLPCMEHASTMQAISPKSKLADLPVYNSGALHHIIHFILILKFRDYQNPHPREQKSVIRQILNDSCMTQAWSMHDACGVIAFPSFPSLEVNPSGSTPVEPAEKASEGKKAREPVDTVPTWEAYSESYQKRYHEAPIRNATVNGMLRNFVNRVGKDEAPEIAAFFVTHNDPLYIRKGHSVGTMLTDAEKLRTEWKTGHQITKLDTMRPVKPPIICEANVAGDCLKEILPTQSSTKTQRGITCIHCHRWMVDQGEI